MVIHFLLQRVNSFLKYYFRAKTKYDIHSPFVADLMQNVIEDDRNFYIFSSIITLRARLALNKKTIEIIDHGAGSMVTSSNQRQIREIVKYSAIPPFAGKMLFRLVNWHKPKTLLELGTSLGISTLYQIAAAQHAKFITIEGCPNTATYAQDNLNYFNYNHVKLLQGVFQQELPNALKELSKLDYLFLDGDHRGVSSKEYFKSCLPFAHENSLFVIADIYWSKEMTQAWQEMVQHPKVKLSIDLYYFGLLFFRTEQKEKEHFTLIKAKYKPWRMGFF